VAQVSTRVAKSQATKAISLVDRFGGSRDGVFAPAGIPVTDLAARYGSPFYLYSGELATERARRVREALGTEVFFSVKANPSIALCQVLATDAGVGAEVASAGELAVALAAGFAPSNILFAGPGKTDDELERAVAAGILADNVESLDEIDRLATAAQRSRRDGPVGVGLRLNPQAQLMGAQMRMGGSASQFGIDEAELGDAVERVRAHPELTLRGIHVYTATQIFEAAPLVEHCRAVFELALTTSDRWGAPLQLIDFGGGFGIPYFEGNGEFDLEGFGRSFGELAAGYRRDPRLAGCRFIFELGRYLVADAGIYVTRVVERKTVRGTTFVITDGGMNHHLTATGNMGQVFRKAYPLLNLSRMDAIHGGGLDPARSEALTVTGPLCTPLDTFGRDVALAETRVGDLIGVFYSGAYGYSASNLGFLSHPTPAEVLLWRNEAIELRPAGDPEAVLSGQRGLPDSLLSEGEPAAR
jgi:diaminopimelate decarboxylase